MFGLAHLVDAVQADQQRHCDDALRFLAVLALQFAAYEQVESLIGTAKFHIGLKGDGVVALHQRVKQLMHGDRCLFGKTLGKVVALKQTSERIAGR